MASGPVFHLPGPGEHELVAAHYDSCEGTGVGHILRKMVSRATSHAVCIFLSLPLHLSELMPILKQYSQEDFSRLREHLGQVVFDV